MRTLNLPNQLTMARLVLSPAIPISVYTHFDPLWWLKLGDYRASVLTLAIFLALTDFFDGFIAKRWNMATTIGETLDPIADFVYCASMFAAILVSYYFWTALFLVWCFVGMCFFLYGSMMIYYRHRRYSKSRNPHARACVMSLMTVLLCSLWGSFNPPGNMLAVIALGGMLPTGVLAASALERAQKKVLVRSWRDIAYPSAAVMKARDDRVMR